MGGKWFQIFGGAVSIIFGVITAIDGGKQIKDSCQKTEVINSKDIPDSAEPVQDSASPEA